MTFDKGFVAIAKVAGFEVEFLARPPDRACLRRLIRVARARWRVELDDRELKEELGLDHYEGRHWL